MMSNCKCGDSLDTTEVKACGACINCAQADLAAANAVIEGQERGILALGARIDGLRTRLAAANETIAKLREAATNEQDHICEWVNGEPSNVYRSEWFIAETTYGDRVVLRELPEDWAYDYTTADGTYLAARKIKRWMQFPDSEFLPYNLPDDYKIVKSADFASANETIGKLLEYGPRVLEALEHTVPSECYATGPLHEDGRDGECVGCAAIKVMGSLIAEAARSQKP